MREGSLFKLPIVTHNCDLNSKEEKIDWRSRLRGTTGEGGNGGKEATIEKIAVRHCFLKITAKLFEHQRVLYAVEKFLLKKTSLFEFVVQRMVVGNIESCGRRLP